MVIRTTTKPSAYYDSLVLMRLTTQLLELPGVIDATVMMGTEQNKHSIGNPVLLTPEAEAAGPNDLFVVVAAESDEAAEGALDYVQTALREGQGGPVAAVGQRVRTLDGALRQQPASRLAILSIPGQYVRREAIKALDAGLHLLIFSDNVPLEEEIELKEMGRERGLLVMGPDCGTAIIGGAALAFANGVRRGRIGLVGASGTGLQEVTCLIDHLGAGVSHAIGTGGRDVSEAVGAITMIEGLKRLDADPGTDLIVIVSKPPAPAVVRKVMEEVARCDKPVVVNFLGGDPETIDAGGGIVAATLEDAAVTAAAQLNGTPEPVVRQQLLGEAADVVSLAEEVRSELAPGQRFVRGLFSGGTFTDEATMILAEALSGVHTNGGIRRAAQLPDPRESVAHTCVDLGADEFTVGKPHPMLEPSLRRERLLAEAADPETAVVLLDIVLGYGVHPDPAGAFAEYIAEAKGVAAEGGRALPVVASVCGVDADPQPRHEQVERLEAAGAIVMASNAQASRLAAAIVAPLANGGEE